MHKCYFSIAHKIKEVIDCELMKFNRLYLLLPLLLLFLVFVSWKWYGDFQERSKVAGIATQDVASVQLIKGLVVPHHELVFSLVEEALLKVSQQQQPKYLVLMGPNHWQPDKYHLTTALNLGDYPLATDKIAQIKDKLPFVVVDEQLMIDEHSVMLLLPELKKYFPQTQVIPLVFSPGYQPDEIEQAVGVLTDLLPADTLYVISTDFAHNQMLLPGLENNQQTIKAMSSFDYQTILDFDDRHLDAAVAMVYFMKVMEKLEAKSWQTWHSTHGAELTGDPTLQGTSYVIGVFY